MGWDKKETITLDPWNSLDPNVTTIDVDAFKNTILKSIVISAKVETISVNAFQNPSSLTTITFEPNSQLITIGEYTFYNNFLISLIIPNSVTLIGDNTFGWSLMYEEGSKFVIPP